MMISINRSANSQRLSARTGGLLVLEPPRHSHLEPSFLGPGKHLIGSGEDCGIRIEANGVQTHHAIILIGDHVILLKALDNRTWVNDGAVSETSLRTGDRLSVGPITFRLRPATAEELQDYAAAEVATPTAQMTDTSHAHRRPESRLASTGESTIEPKAFPASEVSYVAPAELSPPPRIPIGDLRKSISVQEPEVVAPLTVTESVEARIPTQTTSQPLASDGSETSVPMPQTSRAVDSQVHEIQRQITALNDQTAVFDDVHGSLHIRESAQIVEEKRRIAAREDELRRLADELSRQSLRLRERSDRVAQREEELDRKQALLTAEHERIVATAEATQRELTAEYARQQTLWQEWDQAYRRTAEELKTQLETVEQRRAAIQLENEKLATDRAEIQRLHTEYDQQRRAASAERIQTAKEAGDLQAQRAAFETERRQYFANLQEKEAQVASERHALAMAQDELLATRQQIEHDRTLLATERSSESLRREQEIREHTQTRIRLNDEESELQSMRFEIEATRRSLDEQRAGFQREKAEFEVTQAEVAELRARLAEAEIQLNVYHQSQLEQQHLQKAAEKEAERQREELRELNATLADQESQLDSVRNSLQIEQNALIAAREELAAMRSTPRMSASTAISPSRESMGGPSSEAASVDDLLGISPSERTHFRTSDSPEFEAPMAHLREFDVGTTQSHYSPEVMSRLSAQSQPEEWHTSSDASPDARGNVDKAILIEQRTSEPMLEDATRRQDSFINDRACESAYGKFADDAIESGSPPIADETLCSSFSSTTAVDEVLPVVETLSDINHRFGFLTRHSDEALTPIDPTQRYGEAAYALADETTGYLPSDTEHAVDDVIAVPRPASVQTSVDDSLDRLRAQLAEMLLPADNESKSHQTRPDESDSSESDVSKLENVDQFRDGITEQILREVGSDERDATSTVASVEDAKVEVATNEESAEVEDEWARRLRELSKVAAPAPTPAPTPPVEVSSAKSNDESADDEFSVEAQLARLLGRPVYAHGTLQGVSPAAEAKSPRAESALSSDMDPVASETEMLDRSHLASEPKHKQNKSAVREEVQSFRAVAQMSARTALAKHSWNNLRNEFYFTSTVTAASMVAAIWFLGNYVYGTEKDVWKGAVCAAATVVCGQKLVRRTFQLTQWRGKQSSRSKADSAPNRSKVTPDVETPDSET